MKLAVYLIMVIFFLSLICTDIKGYETGVYIELVNYNIPYAHGVDNNDSIKGLGFIMGKYCPRELYEIYARAWGLDAKYHGGEPPVNPSDPFADLDNQGWNDYTVGLLEIHQMSLFSYRSMTYDERTLLVNFCNGINEAVNEIKLNQIEWYNDYLLVYENDFGNGIEPKHVIALYLHDYIIPSYYSLVYSQFSDFGPTSGNSFTFYNKNDFSMGSQMWTFIDENSIPWMQMDTHIGYDNPYAYRPFLCEVRTLESSSDYIGFNYFGWNLLGLPFMGTGVRYPQDDLLPPIAWGFTTHYTDLVDVYELPCEEDLFGRLYYYMDAQTKYELTERDPIVIEYTGYEPLVIDGIYETSHHGPVIKFEEPGGIKEKVYTSRGSWDINVSCYNMVKQGSEMLKAESIEEIIEVMNISKCHPSGSYIFANGNPSSGDAKIKYILAGSIPTREGCYHYEEWKSSYSEWNKILEGGIIDNNRTDIFQDLYDVETSLPQERDRTNPVVDYFINCNCSIDLNNPNSLNLVIGNYEVYPAYLVWGTAMSYRQERAMEIKNHNSFACSKQFLLDNLLLDKCSNWGRLLVGELSDLYDEYIDDLLGDPYYQDIVDAMAILNQWRTGSDPDPDAIFDDALATRDSTEMFLFKLWQCHFIIWYDNPEYTWRDFFDQPTQRISFLDFIGDAIFCKQTLVRLARKFHTP